MFKKISLVFACVSLVNLFSHAENAAMCKAAKDSMKAQSGRGEMGFYLITNPNAKMFYYVKIDKNHYEKIPVKNAAKMSYGKDSMKAKQSSALFDYNQSKNGKSQPLDTNSDFRTCYNNAFQLKLDTTFKCNFYNRIDSVMKAYDKQGKGYKYVDFPGGAPALQKFLDANVALPKEAKPSDSDKVIRILYSFYVDEKGGISEITLIKSNYKQGEALVLDAIKKMPAFTPAIDAGKPKKIKYILPYTKDPGKKS